MVLNKEVVVCLLYALFLALQLLGMILYCIRAVECCVQERVLSYQCKNFTVFSYSLEIELTWLLSHLLNLGISLLVIFIGPEFLGYDKVYRKLIHLPKFWLFYCLLAVAIIDFILILAFYEESGRLQEAVVAAFLAENMVTVVVVGVFNFTPLKELARRLGTFPGVLIKVTLVLFFVTNCSMFLIGTVQLSFKVTGLNDRSAFNLSDDLKIVFRVLRNFAYVVFYLRAASFFWQKIFLDKRNILSHHQLLQSSSQSLIAYI
ncbi:uncharacterized protein LOC116296767 [Actinia tenebrosa]|uniref:Uncharacterized protein LOC116296767 n=1 Tax=Actinia tenebrosa TaxID=6105 RepID=A0A6P8HWC6_ACTTE|nr:uncharacterized protein LOC116296767 [Actinia tenebrosa]